MEPPKAKLLEKQKNVFQHLKATWDVLPLPISKLLLKTGLKDVISQSCNNSIILRILQRLESILKQPNVETNNYQHWFVLRSTPQPYHILFILASIHQFSSFGGPFRLAKSPPPATFKRLQTEWGSKKTSAWNCSTSLRMLCYANNLKRNSDTDICGGVQRSVRALSFAFSELDKQACNTFYLLIQLQHIPTHPTARKTTKSNVKALHL